MAGLDRPDAPRRVPVGPAPERPAFHGTRGGRARGPYETCSAWLLDREGIPEISCPRYRRLRLSLCVLHPRADEGGPHTPNRSRCPGHTTEATTFEPAALKNRPCSARRIS